MADINELPIIILVANLNEVEPIGIDHTEDLRIDSTHRPKKLTTEMYRLVKNYSRVRNSY